MAIVAGFSSGMLALSSASRTSTAGTLADKQMEAYRAQTYSSLASSGTTTSTQTGPDGLSYTVTSAFSTDTTTVSGRTIKVVTVTVTRNSRQYAQEQSTFDLLSGS
jgi:hypothetical protein